MTNRMKTKFLVTTAVLLAGVSLASAQGPVGGATGGGEEALERIGTLSSDGTPPDVVPDPYPPPDPEPHRMIRSVLFDTVRWNRENCPACVFLMNPF